MRGGADAWSVLRILFGIDDFLAVLGGRRWRVERPHTSVGIDDLVAVLGS